jgi:hypothetical protein
MRWRSSWRKPATSPRPSSTLTAEAVPVLVMKGAALSYTYYPAAYLRPRNDDDLVVAPGDFTRACSALERLGYIADSQVSGAAITGQRHYARWVSTARVHDIDLHWRLVNPSAFSDLPGFAPCSTPRCRCRG